MRKALGRNLLKNVVEEGLLQIKRTGSTVAVEGSCVGELGI